MGDEPDAYRSRELAYLNAELAMAATKAGAADALWAAAREWATKAPSGDSA